MQFPSVPLLSTDCLYLLLPERCRYLRTGGRKDQLFTIAKTNMK